MVGVFKEPSRFVKMHVSIIRKSITVCDDKER